MRRTGATIGFFGAAHELPTEGLVWEGNTSGYSLAAESFVKGLIVKAEKSAILKAKRNKERCRTQTIEIQGMLFQHKSALKLLGLQLDGEAAMGAQQAHAVMNQVAKRLRRVTKQISKSGKVTTGVIMRVFDLIATSTCAYSLPHARRAKGPAAIIQTKKMDLLIEMLKLTKDTPHESLRADLGVLDVDIELAVLHLRALHKIYNNREDNLTREMLKWNLKKGATPTSKLDEAQKMLKVLGLDIEISIFLKNTYDRMKELLKQASKKQSAARWTKNTKDGSEEGKRQSHIKPKWGPETAILEARIDEVKTYLSLRHDTLHVKTVGGFCEHCGQQGPTPNHTIWKCNVAEENRAELKKKLEEITPAALERVEKLVETDMLQEATDYLLGGGRTKHHPQEWEEIQRISITQLHKILSGKTEEYPK